MSFGAVMWGTIFSHVNLQNEDISSEDAVWRGNKKANKQKTMVAGTVLSSCGMHLSMFSCLCRATLECSTGERCQKLRLDIFCSQPMPVPSWSDRFHKYGCIFIFISLCRGRLSASSPAQTWSVRGGTSNAPWYYHLKERGENYLRRIWAGWA